MVARTLSDARGRYRFINLKPGNYQVRCYTLNGYVYYQKNGDGISLGGTTVHIELGKHLDDIALPEKRQYRVCLLEGKRDGALLQKNSPDWHRPTTDVIFDDTLDKPGTYTFVVQAIDRDLNDSTPASLTLRVVLPFYKRLSFLIPMVGGSLTLLIISVIATASYLKRRREVQAYQRLAVAELEDARRVQMGFMPDVAPAAIKGLSIAGKCLSATSVSGDFFDYLLPPDGGGEGAREDRESEIAIVVGDVTGHGMQGAMNAVMADGILRALARRISAFSAANLMAELNNDLKSQMEAGMNVTMVIGVINVHTQQLTLANAAHHAYPLLLREGTVQTVLAKGMPLGMMANIPYREVECSLQNGDVIVFMTDGIIEAKDATGADYQATDRLEQTIIGFTPDMDTEQMVDAILADVLAYSGEGTDQEDDMTVVVVKVGIID